MWVLLPITLFDLCRLEDSHGTVVAALLAPAALPPVLADAAAAAVLALAAVPPVLAKSAGAALLAIAAPPPVLTDVATAALLAPAAPPPMLAELAATALFAQAAIPPVLAYAAAAAILAPAARPPVLALSHSTFAQLGGRRLARTTRSGAVLANPRSQQPGADLPLSTFGAKIYKSRVNLELAYCLRSLYSSKYRRTDSRSGCTAAAQEWLQPLLVDLAPSPPPASHQPCLHLFR